LIALGLLPACVPLLVSVPFSGGLVARFGTERLVAAGAVAALAGELVQVARPSPDSYVSGPLPVLLLLEAGFGLSFAALNAQAISTVPVHLRPAAVPLYQTAVQLGGVILLPVVIALAVSGAPHRAPLAVATAGFIGAAASFGGLRSKQRRIPT
jgi:MFS family permease